MNEPGAAKQFFLKGAAKPDCVLRAVSAAITALAMIMAFVSGASSMGSGMIGMGSGVGAAAVGANILVFLPIFVLIGMSIVWAVAFSRSASYESDGSLLRSSAAASMALSAVAFTAIIGLVIMLIGASSMSARSARSSGISFTVSSDALSIIALILTGIGVLCLLPTAISRVVFYRNVQKSMNNNFVATGGAMLFAVMKIINAVVKVGFAVVLLIAFIRIKGAPATAVIFFITAMLALLVSAAANILEMKMAFSFKKTGVSGGYYQEDFRRPFYPASNYPVPDYQVQNHPTPDYQIPNQPAPNYAAPNPQPQEQTIYCPNCGTPNQGGSLFCESCGTKLQ